MSDHDPIVCASRTAELEEALQQAIAAGTRFSEINADLAKINAQFKEEYEHLKASADQNESHLLDRVAELERNRDQFQIRRDEALREAERKSVLLNKVLEGQLFTADLDRIHPEPGDFVAIRMKTASGEEALKSRGLLLQWLKGKFPNVTFALSAPGEVLEFEHTPATTLRSKGLIASAVVSAGMQQLEAAFGTQQAAIKEARGFIVALSEPEVGEVRTAAKSFVEQLDRILCAELVPEKKPTRERAIELLKLCRSQLVWHTDGDTRETPERKALDAALVEALGPDPDDDLDLEDEERE